jgi:hypothetical protein
MFYLLVVFFAFLCDRRFSFQQSCVSPAQCKNAFILSSIVTARSPIPLSWEIRFCIATAAKNVPISRGRTVSLISKAFPQGLSFLEQAFCGKFPSMKRHKKQEISYTSQPMQSSCMDSISKEFDANSPAPFSWRDNE